MFIRKRFIFIALLCFITISLSAQVSVDPCDEFYVLAEKWYTQHYVDKLPQLRPYPLKEIKRILNQVIDKGDKKEAGIALQYLSKIDDKVHVSADGGVILKDEVIDTSGDLTHQETGEISVSGDKALSSTGIGLGFDLGMLADTTDNLGADFLPKYTNSSYDTIDDPTTVGPINLNIDMNSNVSYANDNFLITAGLNRVGFGPFLNEGVVLNDSALHMANIAFEYHKDNWSYSQMMAALGTSLNNGTSSGQEDYTGNKFFSFHSLKFAVTNNFNVGYYETSIFGEKFDTSYLVPAPYMALQGLNGASDNIQMGLLFEYNFLPCISWNTNLMIDDLDANKLVKLNWNGKNRIAAQTGLSYAPKDSLWNMFTFDYTIVTPYTYSHWADGDYSSSTYNYSNYTNHGICMGSSLDPNSDKISFTADFNPVSSIHIKIFSNFIRHANEYESLTDEEKAYIWKANNEAGGDDSVYSTDGSVNTQQMQSDGSTHIATAWDYLNFLTQQHIMYTYQMGINSEIELPPIKIFSLYFGSVSLKAGYEFEYIHNKGVDESMLSGNSEYDTWEDEYNDWVSNLYDEFNSYITLGLKITY